LKSEEKKKKKLQNGYQSVKCEKRYNAKNTCAKKEIFRKKAMKEQKKTP